MEKLTLKNGHLTLSRVQSATLLSALDSGTIMFSQSFDSLVMASALCTLLGDETYDQFIFKDTFPKDGVRSGSVSAPILVLAPVTPIGASRIDEENRKWKASYGKFRYLYIGGVSPHWIEGKDWAITLPEPAAFGVLLRAVAKSIRQKPNVFDQKRLRKSDEKVAKNLETLYQIVLAYSTNNLLSGEYARPALQLEILRNRIRTSELRKEIVLSFADKIFGNIFKSPKKENDPDEFIWDLPFVGLYYSSLTDVYSVVSYMRNSYTVCGFCDIQELLPSNSKIALLIGVTRSSGAAASTIFMRDNPSIDVLVTWEPDSSPTVITVRSRTINLRNALAKYLPDEYNSNIDTLVRLPFSFTNLVVGGTVRGDPFGFGGDVE